MPHPPCPLGARGTERGSRPRCAVGGRMRIVVREGWCCTLRSGRNLLHQATSLIASLAPSRLGARRNCWDSTKHMLDPGVVRWIWRLTIGTTHVLRTKIQPTLGGKNPPGKQQHQRESQSVRKMRRLMRVPTPTTLASAKIEQGKYTPCCEQHTSPCRLPRVQVPRALRILSTYGV